MTGMKRIPLLHGALVAVVLAMACKTTAPALPPAAPAAAPEVPVDRKIAWILRLEQQRTLRDQNVPAPPPPPAAGAGAPPVVAPAALVFRAATAADLTALARDPDNGIRARAMRAIGRVGVAEGLPLLADGLRDPDEQVRLQAAFATGLLGAPAGVAPLTQAIAADPSLLVRAQAIAGLGLIGERSAAATVAAAARGCAATLAPFEPDNETWPLSPEVEVCRQALFALVRLRDYETLAPIVLDAQGQPVSRWWPVAYALQRINDPRASPALAALAAGSGVYTRAFALRGLAAVRDERARPVALALAGDSQIDLKLRVAAVRALGAVGGPDAVAPLLALATTPGTPPNLSLEAVTALGAIGDARAFETLVDLWSHAWPAMRAAAMGAAARVNREGFLLVISSLDRDKEWSVRAALAGVFAELPADRVGAVLEDLSADPDVRVRGPVLEALARIEAPDVTRRLFEALDAPDFALRATAARLLGPRRVVGSAARLGAAYRRGLSDATPAARAAAVAALGELGGADAVTELRQALADPDWPVRLRAATALHGLGQEAAEPVRPALLRVPEPVFESAELLHPRYTPYAFIETTRGTIEIELDVVQAPLTTRNFMELARAGFFSGLKVHRLIPHFVIQAGDPRGDGTGGPGYSIRDELSPQPYLRGTVGMALDGPDTGGSQFFIALSPQPHLDARYTAFGRVRRGIELLDDVRLGDTITQIRIWDGALRAGPLGQPFGRAEGKGQRAEEREEGKGKGERGKREKGKGKRGSLEFR